MLITSQLTYCCFCQTALMKGKQSLPSYWDCPNSLSHPNKEMWIWCLKKDKDDLTDLNIRVFNYQLGWQFRQGTSKLFFSSDNELPKPLIEFPYLFNFELTENNINNKINTILSFL